MLFWAPLGAIFAHIFRRLLRFQEFCEGFLRFCPDFHGFFPDFSINFTVALCPLE